VIHAAPVDYHAFREERTMKKIALSIALTLLAGLAVAQGFPSRPITLIVPFPPGGSTDTTARILGERMRAPLGQTVVIENIGGAGGSIGVARLARAAPDGYTIDIGQWDTHVGGIIYPIAHDLQKDFEPIGLVSVNAQLMIARKGFPADDLKGLVGYMKANPGKATFVDQNAAARVTGILMQQMTNTEVLFVPYRGAGPAMQDMLAQQVDLMVVQAAVTLPQARAGAVKILANLSPARSKVIPTIPTSAESGIPGLYASGWFGLFAPRGTPKEIVARLNAAMVQALADPTVGARLADLGLDMATREQQSPEGLAAFHKGEIEKWWPIIKAAGIKVE
jgi:tripartite-type tricarboxylate transporter receptor subunit TctC